MRWGILGPLAVADDADAEIRLPVGRLRVLLAALLTRANRTVPVDELIELVWDGQPPAGAARTVQVYVVRLRQALGPAATRIVTQPPGYACRVSADELDVQLFETLCQQADSAAQEQAWASAANLLSEALALWRGEPLVDVPSDLLRGRESPRLDQLRLHAIEARIDAQMHLHQHEHLIPQLRDLTDQHPLREHLHAQLMRVLARTGRRAEALDAYHRARRILVDQLGIEPGPELRDLQQRILTGDTEPTTILPANTSPARATGLVPRQLPAVARHFTGRRAELDALTALLNGVDVPATQVNTVVISAIDGMAGIGKTALAVRWAHAHADRFPDGQLYVNLRGFDPCGTPVDTATAVRGFLDALGVPPTRIPVDLDAQLALYRSRLAGTRSLIVVDNARDENQVRALLPGSAGCMVLITSRNRLSGLVALDGAVPLTLDLLARDEAYELLARRLGHERVAHEEQAADELIELCARLPLALNIASASAASSPDAPLGDLARKLRDTRRRLDLLSVGESTADLRAVFSWSYNTLSTLAARVFRLLSLCPGPDVGVAATASLAAIDPDQARHSLDELAAAHLLTEIRPDRYVCHDLLRAYAADQARIYDTDHDRHEAMCRILDHHLHTTRIAYVLMRPDLLPLDLGDPCSGVTLEPLAHRDQAQNWYLAEHPALRATVTAALQAGFDLHAWQITWGWAMFLDRNGQWQDLAAISDIALTAAKRALDPMPLT